VRIDINDFNRKANHILETVVKPQVKKYELSKQLNKYKMENKLNTGAIFKNTNKKADNHPDYKGKGKCKRKRDGSSSLGKARQSRQLSSRHHSASRM
jgi:competence protein ComGC